jgi:hypothetical protein
VFNNSKTSINRRVISLTIASRETAKRDLIDLETSGLITYKYGLERSTSMVPVSILIFLESRKTKTSFMTGECFALYHLLSLLNCEMALKNLRKFGL